MIIWNKLANTWALYKSALPKNIRSENNHIICKINVDTNCNLISIEIFNAVDLFVSLFFLRRLYLFGCRFNPISLAKFVCVDLLKLIVWNLLNRYCCWLVVWYILCSVDEIKCNKILSALLHFFLSSVTHMKLYVLSHRQNINYTQSLWFCVAEKLILFSASLYTSSAYVMYNI